MPSTVMDSPYVGDRELHFSRTFDAPRELVFQAFTDPNHVAQWWGPRGFTLTTRHMDVKPGGTWRFTMHGPDGQDYENFITYLEVDAPNRLVYRHGGDKETEHINFTVTATFEAVGNKTRLSFQMVFLSSQAREHVVKTYGAIDGAYQTFSRLEQFLSDHSAKESKDKPFVISRVFNAPLDLVFKAWTEESRLKEWFGPKDYPIFYAKNDFRPGGTFHYGMRGGGTEIWGKWTWREISPPSRLVMVSTFSDPQGNTTRHPFHPDAPRESLATVTFEPHAGKGRGTVVTITWAPINPTQAERTTFNDNFASMNQGWSGTLDKLTTFLAKG
jgi:uncharacterized protein YndB with AHSA1/START domain